MSGLTERAGGEYPESHETAERARHAWQESMIRQIDLLKEEVLSSSPQLLADRCGGVWEAGRIRISYWGQNLNLEWPDLSPKYDPGEAICSVFDTAMILYYLRSGDGSPLANRWIGYRELPGGAFYANAFQGYSGNRMALTFGNIPQVYSEAAVSIGGLRLSDLPGLAYAYQPLPCIRLATILYVGDEEFPARGSVLFDAAASHYLPTDGLALLGSGLVRRLESL